MGVTLKDEKIVDRWSFTIEGGQGKRDEFYKAVQENTEESQIPGISTEIVKVRTSWLSGFFGNEREYLMVTNEGLKDFRIYVGARDYGIYLDVFCCITCEPGYFKKRLSSAFADGDPTAISKNLNIFEQQDYSSFASHIGDAIEKAFSRVAQGSNSKSNIPKGFMGIK